MFLKQTRLYETWQFDALAFVISKYAYKTHSGPCAVLRWSKLFQHFSIYNELKMKMILL